MRFFLQTVSNNSPYSFINRAIVININGLIVEKFSATKELAVRVDNFLHSDFYKPSPVFIRNDNLKSAVLIAVSFLFHGVYLFSFVVLIVPPFREKVKLAICTKMQRKICVIILLCKLGAWWPTTRRPIILQSFRIVNRQNKQKNYPKLGSFLFSLMD